MDESIVQQLKGVSILCVEDEDGIREMIVNTLKYYFDEVYEASSGEEGYEKYLEYRPKIVLTDIQMKNGNGIEFVEKIREKDFNTMVIMLTAHSNEEYLMELINLNVNHFILKPLNSRKLNDALVKYVQRNILDHVSLTSELILDLNKRELIYNDEHISLRKREKDFLQLLYEHRNGIVTYGQIESELWQDKEMTIHALKSFIKELRGKLPVNIVKNIPQEGYTLDQKE